MSDSLTFDRPRIIVIDDNEAIHEDFLKILTNQPDSTQLDEDEAILFGDSMALQADGLSFEVDSAFQGRNGCELVQEAVDAGRPYALAFVDMRMPPGWDGVETIKRLWQIDPHVQVVICTAYSDYSWRETIDELGQSDQLLILKKPFDVAEVAQLAAALTRKWCTQRALNERLQELEQLVAERTRSLNSAVDQLQASNWFVQSTLDSLSARIAILDPDGRIEQVNSRWKSASDGNVIASPTLTCGTHYPSACRNACAAIPFAEELAETIEQIIRGELSESTGDYLLQQDDQSPRWFNVRLTRFSSAGATRVVVAHEDSTDVRLLQDQLSQAQKLESVGQLAAGVAHEINTPIQYIGDNTRFLQDSFADLTGLLTEVDCLLESARTSDVDSEVVARLEKSAAAADVDFLREEVPTALEQSLEGIDRVSKIVRAMKEFSHPGCEEKCDVNLNTAIESTVTVARNEWKYVADLELSLDPDLPLVCCLPGELNQVLLNILVNASHAIADVVGDGSGSKGQIHIATQRVDDVAEIRISDSGTGIPEHVQGRIFDPFFTTKGVGKGTGQGLALAWSIITDQHNGTLSFETKAGGGTTFIIRLPLTNTSTEEPTHETTPALCG